MAMTKNYQDNSRLESEIEDEVYRLKLAQNRDKGLY
jgi:hypothetical protein